MMQHWINEFFTYPYFAVENDRRFGGHLKRINKQSALGVFVS
jgi:hypothetical protein